MAVAIARDALSLHLREAVSRRQAPSVSFACAWGNGPIHVETAGLARIRPECAAVPASAYPWFSVTKLFTATAVLQLFESGQISLDKPISCYLPECPLQGPFRPTVRHLLSHSSGLANPVPVSWVHLAEESGPSLDELTARLLEKHPKLSFAPGTRFSYSNLNYLLLGQLIERASGEAYESYIARNVLGRLGARHTGFSITSNTAMGYSRRWSFMGIAARFMLDRKFFGSTEGGFTALHPFAVDGAPYGGLAGPAADMLALGRAMLAGGRIENSQILNPETVKEMLAPAKSPNGSPLPAGLGWHWGCTKNERYAYHLGGGGGFRSELRIYPRLGYAVAVIANETSFDTSSFTLLLVR